MTVKQRILAIKLLEKQKKNLDIIKKMGMEIKMKEKDLKK